ncbi:MAG: sodium-dependent transporter [Armatimonadota bacterium]|nr:sodium-dependent transporter [Armatimonadota bacterium]
MDRWSSRLGFVLASTGSAVGLGNIWRFPSTAAENGGGAFVLLFLVVMVLVGVPALMAELALGRRTGRNAVDAFLEIRRGSGWGFVGALGVLAAFLILSYYSVIAGWVLAYCAKAARGQFAGLSAPMLASAFADFAGHPWRPLAWHAAFMLLTVGVVLGGVKRGIERWARLLMPGLVGLLLALLSRVLMLDGALAGAAWFMQPHWHQVTWQAVLRATGQVFFSLSLGMGVMITYGSYLDRAEDIPRSALYVAAADTGIALLSGTIVVSALFAFGLPVEGGAGLIFVTLPAVLGQMPLGPVLTTVFFAMVVVAALTSAVALLEVVVAFVTQRTRLTRRGATTVAACLTYALGIPSALSQGAYPIDLFGRDFLGAADHAASNLLLPLVGLLTALFVGWAWGAGAAVGELHEGSRGFRAARIWSFSIRIVLPIMVAVILLAGLLGIP